MIETFILKWWAVIASIGGLLAGDCMLRGKAFFYIHNKINKKVDKILFDQKLDELRSVDKISISKIENLQEKISLIAAQNQLIVTRLDGQKESSEQADKFLREIISLMHKK